MKLINIDIVPRNERKKTCVKLTYNSGYDINGIFGKGNIGEVSVIINGVHIDSEYKMDYIQNAKEIAVQKANDLGLDFIYVFHN